MQSSSLLPFQHGARHPTRNSLLRLPTPTPAPPLPNEPMILPPTLFHRPLHANFLRRLLAKSTSQPPALLFDLQISTRLTPSSPHSSTHLFSFFSASSRCLTLSDTERVRDTCSGGTSDVRPSLHLHLRLSSLPPLVTSRDSS